MLDKNTLEDNKKKILILGSNGQIGKYLSKDLTTLGEVISLDRDGFDFENPKSHYKCDFGNPKSQNFRALQLQIGFELFMAMSTPSMSMDKDAASDADSEAADGSDA